MLAAPRSHRRLRTRVGLFGFSEFERAALDSYFRLLAGLGRTYELVHQIGDCDLIVANSDSVEALTQVGRSGRIPDTLFIGHRPVPASAAGHLPRPIDARRVRQVLDGIRQRRQPAPRPAMHVRQWSQSADQVLDFHNPSGFSNSVMLESEASLDAVLIVSASPAEREMLRCLLDRYGYHVDVATHSGEALRRVRAQAYAFVFLGLEREGHTALTAARHLRHGRARTAPCIVALIGRGQPVQRLRALFAGCDATLSAPLDEPQLLALLARHDNTFERVFEATAPMAL